MACVSNFGAYSNWTGHVLAGSNSYGFGRLSWSGGQLTSEKLTQSGLNLLSSFCSSETLTVSKVRKLKRAFDSYVAWATWCDCNDESLEGSEDSGGHLAALA